MASTANSRESKLAAETVVATASPSMQSWLVLLLVFVAGAASLSIEMAASRLLAPYFGDSLFVWSSIIGLILLYLTVGYYVGGVLSDRYPRPIFLYTITAAASILIALIPLIALPLMTWAQLAFANDAYGVLYGSLLVMIALFALPTILLGCVSPFAIRIRMQQVGSAGRISGQLYAISTAGSVIGTFLPVLVLLPYLGTKQTFLVTALALFVFSIAGYLFTNKTAKNIR
jgi:predicted membrane-bound spermidine synthase